MAAARHQLQQAGIEPDEAAIDARVLAESLLGWDQTRLLTDGHLQPPPSFAQRFEQLVSRRAAREPVAYLTGRKEFWGLQIEVSPAVLVPRPETELVVETMLSLTSESGRSIRVADICTGSGAIAIAIASSRPLAQLVAADLSEAALAVAQENVRRHGLKSRIDVRRSDLLTDLAGPFDFIVCNPPYIPERDRDTLPPDVLRFEPALALFGGEDGLNVIRKLIDQARERLSPHGALVFEFGFAQDAAVRDLIAQAAGLTLQRIVPDLQGIPRVAVIFREPLIDVPVPTT